MASRPLRVAPPSPPAPPAPPPRDLHPVGRLPDEWKIALAELGEPAYRAKQVFAWIHARGVTDPAKMTDLPLRLRERLAESGLTPPLSVSESRRSSDGTLKLLCELGRGRIECVLIPMTKENSADADASPADDVEPESAEAGEPGERGERDDDDEYAFEARPAERTRITLCVSTQVGCAMGCVFCASGQAGLVRGLGAAEIVSQVLVAREHLGADQELKNLVFMGMGEPLHHYDETARAIRLLTHPDGLGMSPRRITVSTVGLLPGIRRLGADFGGKVGLAVSLHAPDDETRSRIVPMNRRYPVAELIAALRAYPLPRRRRITLEYTLIAGVNDRLDQARALVRLVRGLRVKINLIPMNPIAASELRAPVPSRVEAFRDELTSAGLSAFLRTRRGDDVDAACGQLALQPAREGDPGASG